MTDIQNKTDIERLISLFYNKLLDDEKLKHFFVNMDLPHHLPNVVNFWCFVLLDETGYSTNVIEKHMNLRLREEHFEKWLSLFHTSIDELFKGEKADLAKERSTLVGLTMKFKMQQK